MLCGWCRDILCTGQFLHLEAHSNKIYTYSTCQQQLKWHEANKWQVWLQLSYFIKTAVNLNWKEDPFFWLPTRSASHKREEAAALLVSSKVHLNDAQENTNTRKCKGNPVYSWFHDGIPLGKDWHDYFKPLRKFQAEAEHLEQITWNFVHNSSGSCCHPGGFAVLYFMSLFSFKTKLHILGSKTGNSSPLLATAEHLEISV